MKFFIKINNTWETPDFNTEDDIGLQLYWTFDNLTNPVDYVGEYSYEFTLPFTKKNVEIFKNFDKLDSITSTTSTQVFHPNILIPYIIQTTNDVISTGEAYLSSVTQDGYVIALNGSLCTAFTKLLNSGWDTAKAASDEDYYLFDDVDLVLNKDLIGQMWMNDNPQFVLDPTYTDISEVLTAVPMHQGRYTNFDSNKQISFLLPPLVTDYTERDLFYDSDGNVIDCGDGLTEWQMQEFRSYEQNFAIYVQKLFAIYKRKCEEICDYQLNLDSRWYNNTYQYLQKMVYVLGRLNNKNPEVVENYEATRNYTHIMPMISGNFQTTPGLTDMTAIFNIDPINVERGQVIEYTNEFGLSFDYNTTDTYYLFANWDNPVIINTKFVDSDDNVIEEFTKAYFLLPDTLYVSDQYYVQESQITTTTPYEKVIVRYTPQPASTSTLKILIQDNFKFKTTFDGTLTPKVNVHYYNNQTPFGTIVYYNYPIVMATYVYPSEELPTMNIAMNVQHNTTPAIRSGQKFSFEKVFGDIQPFTVLLKYTKMLGMVWVVDDYNKTITVKRRSDYFWDLVNVDNNMKNPNNDIFKGFYDITDLVDFDSYKITPLAWDTRDVNLNYDEAEDVYMKKYYDKYGRTYGSALIKTENYLNKDTMDLMCNDDYDTIAPSCIVQPFYTPYNYFKQKRGAKLKCQSAPTAQNDKGEQVDMRNNFYFRLANVNLDANMHTDGYRRDSIGNYAYISDDTEFETMNNKFAWHGQYYNYFGGNDLLVRKMPSFSTIRNGYSLQFAAPYEQYFNVPILVRPTPVFPVDPIPVPGVREPLRVNVTYLYDNEFKNYVEEIYNVNNKTLEVNVAVNSELYRRLKSVPLVLIEDVAYLVTEIEGWNEFDNTTKLKLRQIWNYNKLIEQNQSGGYTPVFSWNTENGLEPLPVLPENYPAVIDEATDISVDMNEQGKDHPEIHPIIKEEVEEEDPPKDGD